MHKFSCYIVSDSKMVFLEFGSFAKTTRNWMNCPGLPTVPELMQPCQWGICWGGGHVMEASLG